VRLMHLCESLGMASCMDLWKYAWKVSSEMAWWCSEFSVIHFLRPVEFFHVVVLHSVFFIDSVMPSSVVIEMVASRVV